MKIINFKKKNEIAYKEAATIAKTCYTYKGNFEDKYIKVKKYCKVRDHFHYTRWSQNCCT